MKCVARHLPLHDQYSEEPRFFLLVAETSAVPGAEGAKPPPGEPSAKIIGKSKEEVELRLGLWMSGFFFEAQDNLHGKVLQSNLSYQLIPVIIVLFAVVHHHPPSSSILISILIVIVIVIHHPPSFSSPSKSSIILRVSEKTTIHIHPSFIIPFHSHHHQHPKLK